MKTHNRRIALIAAVIGLLAWPSSALADGGGHNAPTRKLEAAFTAALTARIDSANGCYPAEPRLARLIRKAEGLKTGVAANFKSARQSGIVYVIRNATSCGRVRMALRQRSLYVLDSVVGEVRVQGRGGGIPRDVVVGNRGPLRALRLAAKTFQLVVDHRRERLEVRCPGKTFPLGGGMITPPLGADGEGIYPHSFERLGAQRGWHISGWLMDPNGGKTDPRKVTLQVMCGRGLVPMAAPHRTVFIQPGQTKTATARCPKGQVLMSGGFQRTDFLGDGGNYVTESRAIGPKAWRVSGSAHGAYGGELTAIAYCVKSKRRLLTEIEGSTPLPFGASATATTPPCPQGLRLTSGGFSANGSSQTFFAGGSINADGTWSATGYGFFGAAPSLTAYGYCLRPGI